MAERLPGRDLGRPPACVLYVLVLVVGFLAVQAVRVSNPLAVPPVVGATLVGLLWVYALSPRRVRHG